MAYGVWGLMLVVLIHVILYTGPYKPATVLGHYGLLDLLEVTDCDQSQISEIDFDKGEVNLRPSPKWKSAANNSFHTVSAVDATHS